MSRTLLRAAALQAAARASGFAPKQVQPVALAVRITPETDADEPLTLARPCVEVRVVPHPLLAGMLRAAGARQSGQRSFQVDPAASPDLLARVLGCLPAGCVLLADGTSVPGYRPADGASSKARARVVVSTVGKRVHLRFETRGWTVAGHSLDQLRPKRVLPALTLPAAPGFALLELARDQGATVVDADRKDRIEGVWTATDHRLLLHPAPGAPGLAVIETGALAGAGAGLRRVADAVNAARHPEAGTVVGIDPRVADVAAMTAARPGRIEGLYGYQDECVAAYLATRYGQVNALEPGLGKTVCAASALRAKAAARPDGHRALVVAPVTLHEQWARELSRFHPHARVLVCAGQKDLAAVDEPVGQDAAGGAEVVLMTPHLVARHTDRVAARAFDDLVVDEAAYLRNPSSQQSRALWQVRASCGAAMALTGTPVEAGVDDLGALVAFVRGDAALFDEAPLSGEHSFSVDARIGASVFSRTRAQVSTELPAPHLDVVRLEAGAAERRVDAHLRRRIAAAVAGPSARARMQVAQGVGALRLAACDPAGFARSRWVSPEVEGDAQAAGGEATKLGWAAGRIADAVRGGQRVLVFCDATGPLAHLVARLSGAGVASGMVTSATPTAARARTVAAFQGGQVPVLLLSAAGHLGLNLQGADVVVHLDVPPSPSAMKQRTARAVRIGGKKDVQVLVPVLAGTGEEVLVAAVTGEEGRGARADLLDVAKRLAAV